MTKNGKIWEKSINRKSRHMTALTEIYTPMKKIGLLL